MIKEFEPVIEEVRELLTQWEPKLLPLDNNLITTKRNSQNRTIKQIVGHMIDSAQNNTHRIVHLHYQDENWLDMINLWKYSNIHIMHVIKYLDATKLDKQWHYSEERLISLKEGIIDYPRHLKLHLDEIDELMPIR